MKQFQVILLCTILVWLTNGEPIRDRRHADVDPNAEQPLVVHDEPENLRDRDDDESHHHHHHHKGDHHHHGHHHDHHDDHHHHFHHEDGDHGHHHDHHMDEGDHDHHHHHEGDDHDHQHDHEEEDDHDHEGHDDHHHDHDHQHDHEEDDHDHQHDHEGHDHHHHHHHHEDHDHHHHHHDHEDHDYHNHEDHMHAHRSYKFQVGKDFGAYEYIDNQDDGILKGFYVDIMEQVCEAADHKCYAVYDDPQRCWHTSKDNKEQSPGVGLMSGWYDGCIGYTQSPERANSFEFSEAFTKNFQAAIFVSEESTRTCNPMDLDELKIGFILGWSMNQLCLSRHSDLKGDIQGVETYTEHIFQRYEDMVTAMVKNEIEAMFTITEYVPDHLRLRPLCDVTFSCTKAGISMMTNKGSPVTNWWNKAFNSLVKNGIYQEICQNATRDHGNHGEIHCLN